jgi:hypothetical protein
MAASGVLGPQAQSSLNSPNTGVFGSGLSLGGSPNANTAAAAAGFGGYGGAPEPIITAYNQNQVMGKLTTDTTQQQQQNLDPWSWMLAQFSPYRNTYNSPWAFR